MGIGASPIGIEQQHHEVCLKHWIVLHVEGPSPFEVNRGADRGRAAGEWIT